MNNRSVIAVEPLELDKRPCLQPDIIAGLVALYWLVRDVARPYFCVLAL